jgi:hypothetical protein
VIDHRDEDLRGSRLRNVDLSGSEIRAAMLCDIVIKDAWIENVRIEGRLDGLVVNGVDVTAYVEAELDRRHPERLALQPEDGEALRQAWSEATERTEAMVERGRQLPGPLLDESVDDEYSFIQTLRHLVLASDRWLTGPVFGDPAPYFNPLGMLHEGGEEGPDQGLDPDAHPSLDEVLTVRRAQQQRVAEHLRDTTDAELHRSIESPNGGTTNVLHCLHVVLREEWWHHQYAARDLAILEAREG